MGTPLDTRPLAIVYTRVSTARQVESGASLEAQEEQATTAAEREGYRVEVVREEGRSAYAELHKRPRLVETLHRLKSGEAQALYAAKVDRLARNMRDMLDIAEWAKAHGWRLRILDVDGVGAVDTESASGALVLQLLAAVAEFESTRRSERMRAWHGACSARPDAGKWGVTRGPRPLTPDAVIARIVNERAQGRTLADIADRLNADGEPTPSGRGARWYPSTVRTVLTSPAVTGKARKPRRKRKAVDLPPIPAGVAA